MIRRVPRAAWLGCLAAAGIVVVLGLVLPVGATFADDELLRLDQLDPSLSPPRPTASCGAPLANLDAAAESAGAGPFYEQARGRACQAAAERRVTGVVAGAGVLGMVGLLGLAGPRARERLANRPRRPARAPAGA